MLDTHCMHLLLTLGGEPFPYICSQTCVHQAKLQIFHTLLINISTIVTEYNTIDNLCHPKSYPRVTEIVHHYRSQIRLQ